MGENVRPSGSVGKSIVHVPFRGDTIDAVQDEQGVWVGVRRVCDSFGLSSNGQIEKLKNKPWATGKIIVSVAEDGKTRELYCLHLDALPMWLGNIDTGRVKPEVRDKLIAYQKEAARVLRDHFFGRQQPSPQPVDLNTVCTVVAMAVQSAMAPFSDIIRELVSMARNSNETTIGSRGAVQVRGALLDYAKAMVPYDKKRQRSVRSGAEMDLRAALGFTGTGRQWASFPASRWPDLKAKIEELRRMSVRVNPSQLNLVET